MPTYSQRNAYCTHKTSLHCFNSTTDFGGPFQYKDAVFFFKYWDYYYKARRVSRPSYRYKGNPYTSKDGRYTKTGPREMDWIYCHLLTRSMIISSQSVFSAIPRLIIPCNTHMLSMMTSSNGNIFRVTGPLWGDSIGHSEFCPEKASDAELWCFLWSVPEQTIDAIETPVISDAITIIMTSL